MPTTKANAPLRKSQSALELLVVYSWAILIISVFVALVLILSSPSSAPSELPFTCNIQPLLPCIDTIMSNPVGSSTVSFYVVFENNLPTPITFSSNALNLTVTGVGTQTTASYNGVCNPSYALPNAQVVCSAAITGAIIPPLGTSVNSFFTISYSVPQGTVRLGTQGVYKTSGYSTQLISRGTPTLYALSFTANSAQFGGGTNPYVNATVFVNGMPYKTGTNAILANGIYNLYLQQPSQGVSPVSWSTSSSPSSVSQAGGALNATLTLASNAVVNAFMTATTNNIFYVPILLTNTQASATPVPFQQLLTINSASYAGYINGNWMNVEFSSGPGGTGAVLPAWVEGNPFNTATNTIVWVRLPVSIPASSNALIYMDFMPSNVMSFSGPTGEAPQLSSAYGQYDNGAQVFTYYNNGTNIYGLSAFSGATFIETTQTGPYGNQVPVITLNGSGSTSLYNDGGAWYSSPVSGDNIIIEGWENPFQNNNAAFTVRGASPSASDFYMYMDGWGGKASAMVYLSGSSWTQLSQSADSVVDSWHWLYGSITGNSLSTATYTAPPEMGGTVFSQAPSPVTDTNLPATQKYVGLAVWNGATTGGVFSFWRVRAYPPGGVMPSASFQATNAIR